MGLLGIRALGKVRRDAAQCAMVGMRVGAWAPDGSLVVSFGRITTEGVPGNTMEYADRTQQWSGPGKNEFQENVAEAFAERSPVRLIVVRTLYPERVQAGESANKIPKDFDAETERSARSRSSTTTSTSFGSVHAPTRTGPHR